MFIRIDEKKLLEKLGVWYGSLFPKTSIQDSIKCDVIDSVMTMIEDIEKIDTINSDKIINLLQKEFDLVAKERNRYMATDNLQYEFARGYVRGIMNANEIMNEEK